MKGSPNTGRFEECLQEDKQTKTAPKISYSPHPIIISFASQIKHSVALLSTIP